MTAEAKVFDYERVKQLAGELLDALGLDRTDDNLRDTPRRYADWWQEFLVYDPGHTDTAFESVSADQMVIVANMGVWSLCSHHLLPFRCSISIGYITGKQVLGLSKFARVAHQFAHRPQLQELLVKQIADEIARLTGTQNVGVLAVGEHLCMSARGIKTPARMINHELRGAFMENDATRHEFLSLCGFYKGLNHEL